MLKTLDSNKKDFEKKLNYFLSKRREIQKNKSKNVKLIINDIKKNGDKSLIKYEKKFSNVKGSIQNLKFSKKEIENLSKNIDSKLIKSIDLAFNRIKRFHEKQKQFSFRYKDKYKNMLCYKYIPLQSVGVYVPGGTASYPSTVLMNCIPAIVAGVKNIYLTTPSLGKKIDPAIVYAAKKCGVKEIYRVGGAHSIAAFTYGTKIFKKVDKIVGPGNAYVAAAKKEVFGEVGIDMVAGPSEISVVADRTANPNWVASDLIAQAEHDVYAQSILISNNFKLIEQVNICLKNQLRNLPKSKIASTSLQNYGLAIYCKKNKATADIINEIAPEHLELYVKNYKNFLKDIKNAGSIFIGKYSPEAMGDYLAGPNHVLPTSGSAKFSSGLSVNDFLKRYSLIKITKTGIERLGSSVINLAQHENLEGHANSVKIRLKKE